MEDKILNRYSDISGNMLMQDFRKVIDTDEWLPKIMYCRKKYESEKSCLRTY